MTKKTGLIFTSFILIVNIFISCQAQFEPVIVKDQNSLLWQIKKANQPTSYIYGTMHMINKEYYDFTSGLKSIIKKSDATIMELGSMPNPIQAMLLMTNKKGKLKDIFKPNEWQTILDFYENEFKMTESKFINTYNNFKPFFLFQSMAQAYFEKDAKSYDMDIMQLARENNKELIGLETIDEQIGFFDAIPDSEMASLILESLKTYEDDKLEFKKLEELYSDEKIDELIPLMKEQSPEFMKYEAIFLTDRNKAWIPKLEEHLVKKTCFIAVGAAHLFDESGLISLLRAEGYTVSAVKK